MNLSYRLVLASESPRRQQLLKDAGFEFTTKTSDFEEVFPKDMPVEDVAIFLAEQKSHSMLSEMKRDEVILTADTVVICEGTILGKPKDAKDAIGMLLKLSAKTHEVITGCSIRSLSKHISFDDRTKVRFKEISIEEIQYYIDTYQPFDKAGAYGIQEWIGMIGITSIEGSYYNVVGLPVNKVYENLLAFKI